MKEMSQRYLQTVLIFIKCAQILAEYDFHHSNNEDSFLAIPQVNERVTRDLSKEHTLALVLQMPQCEISLYLTKTNPILPGASLERQGKNHSTATPLTADCYYQGKVDGYDQSYAAIAMCKGVIGTFEVNDTVYSIEPLPVTDPAQSLEQHPHLIRKLDKTGFENYVQSEFTMYTTRSRHKRAPKKERYLEVMIVTDSSVTDFHGEEGSEQYILAIFNLVNLIYSHSSLGITIKLTLVRLLLLSDDTEHIYAVAFTSKIVTCDENNIPYHMCNCQRRVHCFCCHLCDKGQADQLWEGDDPRVSLDRFCAWASINSQRGDSVAGHYDFSMYLSRDRMAPAGYAPVTGMCRPDRSCALIKEDGFSTAFVAAHEIGHVLGLSHDGEGINKCVNEPKRGSIMAPLVMANLNNYFWSPCSADEIDAIVSSLYCMSDDPYQLKWQELSHPLGENWDLNEQCRKDFGEGFKLCSRLTHNFNPCEHLWCSTPENRYLCKTKRAPPLPGSECARGMWCYESKCIVADPDDDIWKVNSPKDTMQTLDGQWSSWSSWSKCSTTCGRGLKSRFRICDNPPPSLGGRNCDGDTFELRICDLPEQMKLVCRMFSDLSFSVRRSCMKHKVYYRSCKREIDDSRAAQCTDYNKSGRTYVPFQPDNSDTHCLLNCKTTEQSIRLYGEIEALDGTFCSYENKHSMCYSGKCIPVGCDGKLYSPAAEDQCGTCQGDGSNCTLRQQFFNEKLQRGEHNLVRLFPGTRKLRLRKPSDVFGIALVNLRTNKTLLAGDGTEQTFTFVDDGVLWRYSNERTQLLETSGPLLSGYDLKITSPYSGMRVSLNIRFTEPIHIIRASDEQPEIETNELPEYQPGLNQPVLAMPSVVTTPKPRPQYEWRTVRWSECSRTCGEGEQLSVVECVSIRTNLTVNIALCGHFERIEAELRRCQTRMCEREYRWLMTEWSECSPSDCNIETPRQRQRYALCVVHPIKSIHDLEQVDESFCSDMRAPPLTEDCKALLECNVAGFWKTGRWSECSVSCGPGTQQREVTCEKVDINLNGKPKCFELVKPSGEEQCMLLPCVFIPTSLVLSSTTSSIKTSPKIMSTTSWITTSDIHDQIEILVTSEGSGVESISDKIDPVKTYLEFYRTTGASPPRYRMTSVDTMRETTTPTKDEVTSSDTTRQKTSPTTKVIKSHAKDERTTTGWETTTSASLKADSAAKETNTVANTGTNTAGETVTALMVEPLISEQESSLSNAEEDIKSTTESPTENTSMITDTQEKEMRPTMSFTTIISSGRSKVPVSSTPIALTVPKGSQSTQLVNLSREPFEQWQTSAVAPVYTTNYVSTQTTPTFRTASPTPPSILVSTVDTNYNDTARLTPISPLTSPAIGKSTPINSIRRTRLRWWWTLTPSNNDKEKNAISVKQTTTPRLTTMRTCADNSPLCELMTESKCRLLLFKKLCCVTCRTFR